MRLWLPINQKGLIAPIIMLIVLIAFVGLVIAPNLSKSVTLRSTAGTQSPTKHNTVSLQTFKIPEPSLTNVYTVIECNNSGCIIRTPSGTTEFVLSTNDYAGGIIDVICTSSCNAYTNDGAQIGAGDQVKAVGPNIPPVGSQPMPSIVSDSESASTAPAPVTNTPLPCSQACLSFSFNCSSCEGYPGPANPPGYNPPGTTGNDNTPSQENQPPSNDQPGHNDQQAPPGEPGPGGNDQGGKNENGSGSGGSGGTGGNNGGNNDSGGKQDGIGGLMVAFTQTAQSIQNAMGNFFRSLKSI